MSNRSDDPAPGQDPIARRAASVAARLPAGTTFAEAAAVLGPDYDELLRAVAQTEPAYAFDREGRPSAIDAVREALPAIERDLLDAILDDVACERAAVEEALYQVALAYGRRGRADR